MRIGIDFDNTIVRYDELFRHLAEVRNLIPSPNEFKTKKSVRDAIRASGKEANWIELQGEVYGAQMHDAVAFPGALEFITYCREMNIPIAVISHKTVHPVAGQKYNLHDAARAWLDNHGVRQGTGVDIYFEVNRDAKLDRIRVFGCTHFIDDLIEFLEMPSFPANV